ncbi:MAG: IS110 family transposase [Candidatus Dormiibacterota bacterium]
MEVVVERCCGLDVHKKNVVACVHTPESEQVRTYGTVTRELLRLLDWLQQEEVTALAMESTGSYWKPVYNLFEGQGIKQTVVNPAHMKAVPGRKTDVKDAQWIADLLRHGLLRSSRIPERPQRELQEAVRYRQKLIETRSDEVRRVQKVLEGGNIKLGDVAADILGKSGRAMLVALIGGETDSSRMAELAQGQLRKKREALGLALEGSIGPHQRFMLQHLLEHIDFLEQRIEEISVEIETRMRPFEPALEALDAIPGIGRRSAETIVAEVGTDMSYWPNDKAFASWAKICPGNNESAGKRRSSSIGQGNQSLRGALVEAAQSAVRVKDSYFSALYYRLKARRGAKRALVAVAHAILVVIYHMLKDGTFYQDLGRDYFDHRDRQAIVQRNVRRLENLGYQVTLSPLVA